jgi:hypothetical protein
VVWCGVAWRGVAWCGEVWCAVVWRGVAWRGVAWPEDLPVRPAHEYERVRANHLRSHAVAHAARALHAAQALGIEHGYPKQYELAMPANWKGYPIAHPMAY